MVFSLDSFPASRPSPLVRPEPLLAIPRPSRRPLVIRLSGHWHSRFASVLPLGLVQSVPFPPCTLSGGWSALAASLPGRLIGQSAGRPARAAGLILAPVG